MCIVVAVAVRQEILRYAEEGKGIGISSQNVQAFGNMCMNRVQNKGSLTWRSPVVFYVAYVRTFHHTRRVTTVRMAACFKFEIVRHTHSLGNLTTPISCIDCFGTSIIVASYDINTTRPRFGDMHDPVLTGGVTFPTLNASHGITCSLVASRSKSLQVAVNWSYPGVVRVAINVR